jgi:hypothetical protein
MVADSLFLPVFIMLTSVYVSESLIAISLAIFLDSFVF